MNKGEETRTFEGKASAPVVPSIQAAYKKGNWAFSGSVAVTGGGGKATFEDGLPSFEALAGTSTQIAAMAGYKANQYQVEQHLEGSNYTIGGQLGATYRINDMFSAYGGLRTNVVRNSYNGYLRGLKMNLTPAAMEGYSSQMVYATQLLEAVAANPQLSAEQKQQIGIMAKASSDEGAILESKQAGWGVAPILGFNFNYLEKLNIGVKYEFRMAIDVENETERDDTGMYPDGVKTGHDIPALFTIGASYQVLPQLQASAGYHHFFDSDAKMAGGKQKDAGSTNEYMAGLEYRINKMFLVSGGVQLTNYGVNDAYHRDLSFTCKSFSTGLGGAVNLSPTIQLNAGYFWTSYSDYDKKPGGGTDRDIFSRTNKVFAVGVDFSF
jgi:long-chain fatty acid transport protein